MAFELLADQFMGKAISALGGGQAAPAGPSHAEAQVYGAGGTQDSSGWNVNFSGVQHASAAQDKSGGVSGTGLTGPGARDIPGYVWGALAALVAWKLFKSRR